MASVEEIQRKILENLKSQLENQLKILESTKNFADEYSKKTQIEMDSVKEQLETINKELEEIDEKDLVEDDSKLENLVSKSEENLEAQESLNTKIANLTELRNQMNFAPAKKIIDMRVERVQKKLETLQKSAVKLESRQRAILLKKQTAKTKREMMLSKQEAKVEYEKKQSADLQNLKGTLEGNSIGNRFVGKIYDIGIKHYSKKAERSRLILEVMQRSGVGLKGANAIIVSKKAKEKLSTATSKMTSGIEEMMSKVTSQTLEGTQSKSI